MRIGKQSAVTYHFGNCSNRTRHYRNSTTHRFGDCDAECFVNCRLDVGKRRSKMLKFFFGCHLTQKLDGVGNSEI